MQNPNVQIVLIEQLKWVKTLFLFYPLSTIHHTYEADEDQLSSS